MAKRLFLGFAPNEKGRSEAEQRAGELWPLLPSLRWIPSENLHVTLHFLGKVEEDTENLLKSRLFQIKAASVGVSLTQWRTFSSVLAAVDPKPAAETLDLEG